MPPALTEAGDSNGDGWFDIAQTGQSDIVGIIHQ